MKFNIFAGIDMSEEAVNKRRQEAFTLSKENPENMSYWLPKILASTTKDRSVLKVPITEIVPLDFEMWKWLRSDQYTPEKITELNDFLVGKIGGFLEKEKTLFMKTGTFSNKFSFDTTVIENDKNIGEKLLNMFYTSMMLGADETAEVVFRQMVKDKEERLKIYGGMPLHTEFRIFYDFDSGIVIGVSNYWHPDIMVKGNLSDQDLAIYLQEKEKIVSDFNQYKHKVAEEVQLFVEGETNLQGRWSIDVMKNGDEFWLIDMARMERSALIQQIEQI
jgi:hypothetical protein